VVGGYGVTQVEHERAVLSAIKADNAAWDEVELSPDDFQDAKNRAVYKAMGRLIESGMEANDLSIHELFRKHDVTGVPTSYVTGLDVFFPGQTNLGYYVTQVREASRKRKLSALLRRVGDELEGKDTANVVSQLESGLAEITQVSESKLAKLSDFLHETVDEIERLYSSKGEISGVPTGFDRLDNITGGFQSGDLIIIGARPSVGKTALALSMVARIVLRHRVAAGMFSCEMSRKLVGLRLLSSKARISLKAIRNGMLQPADFRKITAAAGDWYEAPLWLDDTPNISLAALKSRARTMARRGARIVFVDYLTLVQHGESSMPRHERVGEVSKSLKNLARELDIPIVALSQVRRDTEGRMPQLSDLRQSGEIEEDADMVIFLDRERSGDNIREARCEVAKSRNSETGTLELVFTPQFVTFEDKA
jgi:replicative DNA helicase